MLYGPKGPMIMGSVLDYLPLAEPTNQQLPKNPSSHRSLLPRLEKNGHYSCYYSKDVITKRNEGGKAIFTIIGGLSTRKGECLEEKPTFIYEISKEGLHIRIKASQDAKFVLPLINGKTDIESGTLLSSDDIFFLTGGFKAKEYVVAPSENGDIAIFVR